MSNSVSPSCYTLNQPTCTDVFGYHSPDVNLECAHRTAETSEKRNKDGSISWTVNYRWKTSPCANEASNTFSMYTIWAREMNEKKNLGCIPLFGGQAIGCERVCCLHEQEIQGTTGFKVMYRCRGIFECCVLGALFCPFDSCATEARNCSGNTTGGIITKKDESTPINKPIGINADRD